MFRVRLLVWLIETVVAPKPKYPASAKCQRRGMIRHNARPKNRRWNVIAKYPFGSTGHQSTRVLFGAAALGGMKQEKADPILDLLLEYGINHIDTAASYGDSELRIGPWMREHHKDFFLATKTGDRTYEGARTSLHRSLERLKVDQIDLIQMQDRK